MISYTRIGSENLHNNQERIISLKKKKIISLTLEIQIINSYQQQESILSKYSISLIYWWKEVLLNLLMSSKGRSANFFKILKVLLLFTKIYLHWFTWKQFYFYNIFLCIRFVLWFAMKTFHFTKFHYEKNSNFHYL